MQRMLGGLEERGKKKKIFWLKSAEEWADCYLEHNRSNNVKMLLFLKSTRTHTKFFFLAFALTFNWLRGRGVCGLYLSVCDCSN